MLLQRKCLHIITEELQFKAVFVPFKVRLPLLSLYCVTAN